MAETTTGGRSGFEKLAKALQEVTKAATSASAAMGNYSTSGGGAATTTGGRTNSSQSFGADLLAEIQKGQR